MTTSNRRYVQYGCGWCAPNEWMNFDSSPTLLVEKFPGAGRLFNKNLRRFPRNVRYGNIVYNLGLPNNFADGAYASHVLEHLSLDDFNRALKNTFGLLKPDATFRLVVPDLEWRARQYVTSLEAKDSGAASMFLRNSHLGRESSPKSLMTKLSLLFGASAHLWMWDEFSLHDALVNAGFDHVRRCKIGDSADPMFDLVEDRGRFVAKGFPELAFEAKKPPHLQTSAGPTNGQANPRPRHR